MELSTDLFYLSLSLLFLLLLEESTIFRKNFYFEFYDEVETIFHRDVRAERDEERKKKKRGKGNARARQ